MVYKCAKVCPKHDCFTNRELLSAPPVAGLGIFRLMFCRSCSSRSLAVHAGLAAATRAVNCWLQFLSNLESARQRSKAFEALKYDTPQFDKQTGSRCVGRALRSGVQEESALVSQISRCLSSIFSLPTFRSLQPRSWKIWMMKTSALGLWMRRKTPRLPRNWVSVFGRGLSGRYMALKRTPAEFPWKLCAFYLFSTIRTFDVRDN